MTDSRRPFYVLSGIGLVLTGLLAGILIMLVVDDDADPVPITRVVERVQLGEARPAAATSTGDTAQLDTPRPAALSTLFNDVAKRVTPAVVFIQVRADAPEEGYDEFEGDMRDFFRGPMPRQSVGSGVLISPQGYIVTNNHVVESAGDIEVTLADKRQYEGTVVGTDASTDLAVIKIDADEPLPAVPIGNSDRVGVGDWVVAVGNPFRLTSTVTAGIVSALGRQVGIINDDFRIENFIQTDAAINPGNSGGALVNMRGELVGINTAIATESGSYEGYGFAVPANLVDRVVQDLIAYGDVRRGFLGVSIQEVNDETAREVGLSSIRGVYVADVRSGGAADRAGMASGDIILKVDGKEVDAPNELQSAVAQHRPGDRIRIQVWRDGTQRTMQVRLMGRDALAMEQWTEEIRPQNREPNRDTSPDESPDAAPESAPSGERIVELDAWAAGLTAVTSAQQNAFGVDAGAYVAYVESGGAAEDAGLPRDVVIVRMDGAPVEAPSDIVARLERTDGPVLLEVQRRDGTRAFYEVG